MKFILPCLIAFGLTCSLCSASAQLRPDIEIPPEGYFESDGRLILPLRKVIGGMKLVAGDMGSAYAGCPGIRPKLAELKELLDAENIARLSERSVSKAEYTVFWGQAHRLGQDNPVSTDECHKEEQMWQKMLENIRNQEAR